MSKHPITEPTKMKEHKHFHQSFSSAHQTPHPLPHSLPHQVLWQKKGGQVVSLRKKTYSGDKRHKVLHTERREWSLQIRRVQQEDLGQYTCVVNTNPPLTRTVTLREGKADKHPGSSDKVPETGRKLATKGLMLWAERDRVIGRRISSVQFSLLTDWGVGWTWGTFFSQQRSTASQPFVQETIASRSGMGRDVHSLTLFIQHSLCRP